MPILITTENMVNLDIMLYDIYRASIMVMSEMNL